MRPPVTPASIVAGAKLRHGRASTLKTEFLRLLEERVPGAVALFNEAEGLTIPIPVTFYDKSEEKTELILPSLVVDSQLRFEPLGSGQFKKVHQVSVFVLVGRIVSREDVDNSTDLAEIIDFCFVPSLVNQVTPEGKVAWNTCAPQGIGPLSADWKAYSGCTLTYVVDQAGCTGLWS